MRAKIALMIVGYASRDLEPGQTISDIEEESVYNILDEIASSNIVAAGARVLDLEGATVRETMSSEEIRIILSSTDPGEKILSGVVSVNISEMIEADGIDEFKEILSTKLTGSPFMTGVTYAPVFLHEGVTWFSVTGLPGGIVSDLGINLPETKEETDRET